MMDENKTTKPQSGQCHSPAGRWRFLWGIIVAAPIAAAGYGLYWNMLADQVRDGIGGWAADRRAEGYRIDYGPVRVDGFPFRIRVVIPAPVVSKPGGERPWHWRGPALSVSARPWAWTRTQVRAPGRHLVTVTMPGKTLHLDLTAGALDVSVDWGGGPTPPLQVRLRVKDVSYRSAPVAGLGRTTQRLDVNAELTGGWPKIPDAAAMAQWRDNGGTVEIRSLAVRHGPLEMDGDGTLALDGDLQPLAAFSLGVRGFIEAVDGLRDAGVIKARPAELAKTVLALLGGSGRDGEGGRIKVPLSIQDKSLYIGPVAVARVPPVHWSGGG